MTNITIDKFQFKRGNEANVPSLDSGEPFISEDSHILFVGTPAGNIEFAKKSDVDANTASLAEIATIPLTKYQNLVKANGSWSLAIAQAIADTKNTGKEILLPCYPTIVYVDAPIVFETNTKIRGYGTGSVDGTTANRMSIIKLMTGLNCDVVQITKAKSSGKLSDCVIRGDAGDTGTLSTTGNGITIGTGQATGEVNNINVCDVIVEYMAQNGIYVDNGVWLLNIMRVETRYNKNAGIYNKGTDNLFNNIGSYFNAFGLYCDTSAGNKYSNIKLYLNGNSVTSISDVNYQTDNAGLFMQSCTREQFTNIEIQENYHMGAMIRGCSLLLLDMTFDDNGLMQNQSPNVFPIDTSALYLYDSRYIQGRAIFTGHRNILMQQYGIYISNTSHDISIDYEIDPSTACYQYSYHSTSKNLITLRNSAKKATDSMKYLTDFLNGTTPSHWNVTSLVSGTIANSGASGAHPGVLTYSCNGTANSGVSVLIGSSALKLSGNEKSTFVFQTNASFANITRYLGFIDTTTATSPSNGVWGNIDTTGLITGKCANGGTVSTTSNNYQLAAFTWYRLVIQVNPTASSVTFTLYQDNGDVVLWTNTVSTNIPTGNVGHGDICTSTGASAVGIGAIDYIDLCLPNARPV